ncbi:C-GCAxxG-C-C family protein [Parabacteroides sp. PF5-9]|uniref:C-GCAxxG-C-C family protein n=1 Tax=Parabacteroides sp. PF5-9 TaxID=1742404 RepID=UPI002472EF52|nr:C-GCAxxG-C-C family protein [Parabacteroides sp. PF5-9]MDH6356588.1 C_GCAxxG_C_C family probable redox protein [Parabacteroides sp. PF5-9]
MKDFVIEDRVQKAIDYFESGYNCAQSVFLAYHDLFDLDMETAKKMTVSFGGGIGRLRETCGTTSGMAMLAGFRYPVIDTTDKNARTLNYAIVQKMVGLFKEKYGTINCKSLLQSLKTDTNPEPSPRTPEYYTRRPCGKFIVDATEIAGRMLKGEFEAEIRQAI